MSKIGQVVRPWGDSTGFLPDLLGDFPKLSDFDENLHVDSMIRNAV